MSCKKGSIPWNKDTKGICKANSGSFKKGYVSKKRGKTNIDFYGEDKSKKISEKLSIATKNQFLTMSHPFKNKIMPKEFGKKVSQGLIKGYTEGRIIPPWLGKHRSEGTKLKIKLKNTGRIRSEENRKNMSKSHLGHGGWKWSDESCNAASETRKKKMQEGKIISPWKNPEIRTKNVNTRRAKDNYKCKEETKLKIKITVKKNYLDNPLLKELISSRVKEALSNVIIRKKIKDARAMQILPLKDSSIEIKIQQLLDSFGIKYLKHQWMNIEHGYQCDILIPVQEGITRKTIIECFGTYWHKYPVGREKDTLRCHELREKGWRVIVLWENEIHAMELNDLNNILV